MALFQIAEPGQSTSKTACGGPAIGIDLGTTNSLAAIVQDGEVVMLPMDKESHLLPSVVHYAQDSVLVGESANLLRTDDAKNTFTSIKRLLGKSTKEATSMDRGLHDIVDSQDTIPRFSVRGRAPATPVEISAAILLHVKKMAEKALTDVSDQTVEQAVITVPAYFDDSQRQATRDAGRLAGLQVLRLLAEPTAAAVAYGLHEGTRGRYAVYDLGGGTFDISILDLVDGIFRVVATGGDTALGGDDFDHAIAEKILGFDASTSREVALVGARGIKEQLTKQQSTTWLTPSGNSFVFTREDLRQAAKPLLDKTAAACRRALRDGEMTKQDLDGVILVGGQTRSPVVSEFVASWFGVSVLSDLDPDKVVAMGAAVQAAHLAGNQTSEVVLLDVLPLSLGIETMGGVVEKIIMRNSTIPTRAKQEFTTYADNQTGFDIHVLQGERETSDTCRSLARFCLRGIPPMMAGMAKLEITFAVDADGLLCVTAKETTTGQETSIDVTPSYGLTDDEVERMLLESYEYAEADLLLRNLVTERTEAEGVIIGTEKAMAKDADLLTAEESTRIAGAVDALRQLIAGDDYLAIRAGVEALDTASRPFAEKRMNLAVVKAVRGQRVEDLSLGGSKE